MCLCLVLGPRARRGVRRYNELQLGAEARLELERLRDEGVDALGHLGRRAHLVRVRVRVRVGVRLRLRLRLRAQRPGGYLVRVRLRVRVGIRVRVEA